MMLTNVYLKNMSHLLYVDLNSSDNNVLTKDVDEDGILFISKLDKEKINNVKFVGEHLTKRSLI